MQGNTLKPFVFLLAVIASVSLACSLFSGGGDAPAIDNPPAQPELPTKAPVIEQPTEAPVVEQPTEEPSSGSSDFVTFTDRNGLYKIEVPGDWLHSDETGDSYYIDQFLSPDGNALIENLVYDDGEPFTGRSNGKVALGLLHTYYSYTDEEGDIRVSDDKIMPDGSERLTWSSRGGGYSGMSFFEVRNKTTFLMFTVRWPDDAENDYVDILNRVIESYVVP